MPSATEIVFGIGAGDRLVGVTHECDWPAEALRLPRLTSSALPEAADSATIDRHVRASLHAGSSLYYLDSPKLEELAPDLIITQELCAVCAVSYEIVAQAARKLKGDPRIVSLEPSSLDDVYANILLVGELAGAVDGARELVARLRSRAEALSKRVRSLPRPKTLVLEWSDPPMSAGHWTPGLVELAGGEPLLSHPGNNSQTLDWAAIEAAQPEVAIVVPCGYDIEKSLVATQELESQAAWQRLPAANNGSVFVVDGNAYANRPGPRLIETAELFAWAMHPDEFPTPDERDARRTHRSAQPERGTPRPAR